MKFIQSKTATATRKEGVCTSVLGWVDEIVGCEQIGNVFQPMSAVKQTRVLRLWETLHHPSGMGNTHLLELVPPSSSRGWLV